MKKYTTVFLKNRLLITSLAGSFFFLLFFFLLLLHKGTVYPPVFAFLAYVPFVIWFGIDALLTVRFREMIRRQEERLNIGFDDTGSEPLFPGSTTYLSDSWLIFSGKEAFHRLYIVKVSIKTVRTGMGNDYYLKITTLEEKTFAKAIDSCTNAKKVKFWFENANGPE